MAISNIQSSGSSDGSASLVITDDAGNDRIVVVVGCEERFPPSIANLTVDSAEPTGDIIAPLTSDFLGIIGAYWLDADLPATGGTYTVAAGVVSNNNSIAALSCSGAAQQAPTDPQTEQAFSGSSLAFTLSAAADAISYIALCQDEATQSATPGAGQTEIISTPTTQHPQSYELDDLSPSYALSFSTEHLGLAFAIEPAAGGGNGASPSLTVGSARRLRRF